MAVSLKPSAQLVRNMLKGHSAAGLTACFLLYLICVTGTFCVFYQDFERWEQPTVREYQSATPAQVATAAENAYSAELAATGEKPDHVYIALPTADMPRLAAYADDTTGHVQPDGSLGEPVNHEWTHFLTELHYALTLPSMLGLALVGVAGVMMVVLIVTGLLAHPNIFKDAFALRLGGSDRLRQVDLHNRLSVWSSPFMFFIALTGALIGLSQILVFAVAAVFFDGDTTEASRSLFLSHATPDETAAPLADVEATYRHFLQNFPEMAPLGLTVHEPGTVAQSVEVSALVPNRIVWSEMFAYDADGKLLETAGWSTGDAGVQVYASMYRLHFGHFGGLPVKLLYTLLGLVMCYVTITGFNIWLRRQRQRGAPAARLERLWSATIWGVPAAVALSALTYLSFTWNPVAAFWLALLASLVGGWFMPGVRAVSLVLRAILAGACALLLAVHITLFGSAAFGPAALLVNLLWLALGIATGLSLWADRSAPEPVTRAASLAGSDNI